MAKRGIQKDHEFMKLRSYNVRYMPYRYALRSRQATQADGQRSTMARVLDTLPPFKYRQCITFMAITHSHRIEPPNRRHAMSL